MNILRRIAALLLTAATLTSFTAAHTTLATDKKTETEIKAKDKTDTKDEEKEKDKEKSDDEKSEEFPTVSELFKNDCVMYFHNYLDKSNKPYVIINHKGNIYDGWPNMTFEKLSRMTDEEIIEYMEKFKTREIKKDNKVLQEIIDNAKDLTFSIVSDDDKREMDHKSDEFKLIKNFDVEKYYNASPEYILEADEEDPDKASKEFVFTSSHGSPPEKWKDSYPIGFFTILYDKSAKSVVLDGQTPDDISGVDENGMVALYRPYYAFLTESDSGKIGDVEYFGLKTATDGFLYIKVTDEIKGYRLDDMDAENMRPVEDARDIFIEFSRHVLGSEYLDDLK